jgi:type I restriction enzyme S subunit
MVNRASDSSKSGRAAYKQTALSTEILLSEVFAAGCRLEAAAFGIEGRNAVEALKNSKLSLITLFGAEGLCKKTNEVVRFKRIYVDSNNGVPFLSSSDVISMRPEISNYLSRKLTKGLDELLVRKWDVLISRSGTVGNVGLAGTTHAGKALSEHAIRLRADTPEQAGYVSCFLRSRYGRPQLVGASYGSVVVHIEPSHLKRVLIPNLHPVLMTEIGAKMRDACQLRDDANHLLDEAEAVLHERLMLPRLNDLLPSLKRFHRVHASGLDNRFEASYHDPVAEAAIKQLSSVSGEIAQISDSRVLKELRPITKFRKRVYVPQGGIPFISSKQMFQIDPVDVNRLARGAHTKDLVEIALKSEMILVTRSGTIGRVQITPAYMNGWAGSEHATRFIAAQDMNPGYLYAWLASDYGTRLIKRNSYGSVILEVDKEMFGSIPIPLADAATRNEIGDLVLKANQHRNTAWLKEREAISHLESLIAGDSR